MLLLLLVLLVLYVAGVDFLKLLANKFVLFMLLPILSKEDIVKLGFKLFFLLLFWLVDVEETGMDEVTGRVLVALKLPTSCVLSTFVFDFFNEECCVSARDDRGCFVWLTKLMFSVSEGPCLLPFGL